MKDTSKKRERKERVHTDSRKTEIDISNAGVASLKTSKMRDKNENTEHNEHIFSYRICVFKISIISSETW